MTELKSLCEAFQQTAATNAGAIALRTPGGVIEITWADYADRVRRIAAGLAALGVTRGHTVGLMMSNRPEFHLCDAAAMHLGAAPFSIYNTSAPEQIAHVLGNAGNRVMICEPAFVERVRAAGGALRHIVCVDSGASPASPCRRGPAGTLSLEELEDGGAPDFDFEAAWRAVGPHDVLTLIYTSGTTGPPKGVELTHANMLTMLAALAAAVPLVPEDRVLSYLPSAHLADRLFSHYQSVASGLCVTSLADAKQLGAALLDVRPTLWLAVPRIFEKLKAGIEAGLERETDPVRRDAVRAAIDVGLRKVRAEQAAIRRDGAGPDLELLDEYKQADATVLSAVRRQIGLDQVRQSATGAAPSSVDVLEFFGALGLPIQELWGMSEIGVATCNLPGRERLGTVGVALPGYELRLAPDGELLSRGPATMKGYRHDPEKTAEAIDAEGWMHTGDVAAIDQDGYVTIIDRKKELIINSGGKNMSPVNIESKLKSADLLIGQAVAVGDRRHYNVALIVLDPDACSAHAATHGLPSAAPADLCHDPGVRAIVEAAVEQANSQLSRAEQIKRFAILPVDWEPGGDELTPTSKLRRKPIAAKYAAVIDSLYA
jgi:long-subunit acyl-CoA synthetase (AMP-forming)